MSDKDRLDRRGITPKKSLGQNFLHDPNTLEKIVTLADLSPETTVLEIGPGTGNLTRLLARTAARVVCVELDDRLVSLLLDEFAAQPRVAIIHGDILTVDLVAWLGDTPYTVVANLPYYITSAILRRLFEDLPRPQRLVVTVQREVADRIVAQPGAMSLLSVSIQFYGQAQIAMKLNPALFWPRPDVESAVVRIDTYDQPPVSVPNADMFFRVARAGFGQKRKQLRNAISAGLGIDKARAEALLAAAAIAPQRRAETLSLEEWAALARALAAAID